MKGIAIFLLAMYSVVLLKPIIPVLDYAVNYEYIKEVLCINKDVPEMQCDGKCYLRTQLAEVEEEQESPAAPNPTTEFETDYWMSASKALPVVSAFSLHAWGQAAYRTLAGHFPLPLAPPWS